MTFPHCDSAVLHAPGKCRYCDMHPDWQQYRLEAGINFTGEGDPRKAPDPAEAHRPLETINRWGGNTPETRTDEQISRDWSKFFAEVDRLLLISDLSHPRLGLRFGALKRMIKRRFQR